MGVVGTGVSGAVPHALPLQLVCLCVVVSCSLSIYPHACMAVWVWISSMFAFSSSLAIITFAALCLCGMIMIVIFILLEPVVHRQTCKAAKLCVSAAVQNVRSSSGLQTFHHAISWHRVVMPGP